jgi:putative ABC transport system permease protein
MFRNYLVTALRNLGRNWVYGAISILGLAVAFTAALLIAQFVRNEFSYDRWIPGYQKVYKLTDVLQSPGQPAMSSDVTQSALAGQLKVALPGAVAARLAPGNVPLRHRPQDVSAAEASFGWADPEIFRVFPLPVLAGDLASALQQPDTVVLTRRMARKYFGRDLPIGETLQVQAGLPPPPGSPPPDPNAIPWHPLRVTAVLKDLPSNTNLATEIFASGRSAYSVLTILDSRPSLGNISTYTFLRLSPKQTDADLQRVLPIVSQPEQKTFEGFTPGSKYAFHAVPLSEAHLTAPGLTGRNVKPTGSRAVAYAIAGVGALIVLVAAINFVTLMTARAARRAVEVGVRKATGAQRRDLVVQFVGEALIQVGLGALIAVLLAEALIRPFSAFVQRELALDFIHDPALLAGVVVAVLGIGLAAAIYPAMVLSSFRPAAVLKGGLVQTSGSPIARQALVVIQFAILVGLILTTATLYRQTRFALGRGLGAMESSRMVTVFAPCNSAFPGEVRKLRGVAGAACSSYNALSTPNTKNIVDIRLGGGRRASFDVAPVDFGFFELYGIQPLAGRLFMRDRGEDGVITDPKSKGMPTVVINQAAARVLGFADPRQAIGKPMIWTRYLPPEKPAPGAPPIPLTGASRIVGVVPDMPVTVRAATDPTFYYVIPRQQLGVLSVKLTGQDMPGAVKAIAATWKKTGNTQPLQEVFLSQFRLALYLDLIIQGVTIGICAVLAVLIACLGLYALSAYTTERRTKEIGVRKAMGADTSQVVLLLLWQFTIPVLVATAIAIPIGFLAMDWWLSGFTYHVQLSPGTFVLAAVAGLVIAWLTVSWQSFVVARAKPAGALRYE